MSENTQRPPVGAAPYYIQAAFRIEALGEAIQKYSSTDNLYKIKEWASEIILQCDLISEMRCINREDSMEAVETWTERREKWLKKRDQNHP